MNIKKNFLFLLLTIVAISLSTNMVFASGNDLIKETLSQDSVTSSAEKDSVLKALKDSMDNTLELIRGNGSLMITSVDKESSYSSNKMYKLFMLNEGNFIDSYKKGKTFESLISDEYIWEAPILDTKGNIISINQIVKGKRLDDIKKKFGDIEDKEIENTIKNREGKWYVASTGTSIPLKGVEFISNRDAIASFLLTSGLQNPSKIKVVSLPKVSTYMIYIKDKNGEFGIPFTSREDFSGATNGKLYKLEELFNIFEKSPIYNSTGHKNSDNNGNALVGGTGVDTKNNASSSLTDIIKTIISNLNSLIKALSL